MATDLGQQPKTAPVSKYEQLVEQQLTNARRRIRRLDALGSVFILLLGVLSYTVLMAVLDRAFRLPAGVRTAAFVTFLVAISCYLGVIVSRLVRWTVNPYYAARRLEETIPDAKNSLINWLDLRDEPMAPVIRGTLGRKAAKDLGEADLETAVSGRRALWLAGASGGLILALVVWFLMGPAQFGSLLRRAFFPFEKAEIANRTEITVVQPHGGDATVGVREQVRIKVKVSGRVPRINQPDALQLHFRYRQTEPYIVRPLEEDANEQWMRTLVPDDVRDGFWYKVTGGDAETPEYQVKVRAIPQVMRYEVKYHFRPYLRQPDVDASYGPTESQVRPDIKVERGTEVTLTAHTNRVWETGHLIMRQGVEIKQLPGEAVADDPEAKRFTFTVDEDGHFHIEFTSKEKEQNVDRLEKYRIEALTDRAPVVVLNKPGKDVELPANGTLALEGAAADDHGLKSMTLRLRVKKGPPTPELEAKPYRPGVSFKLADGTYPQELTYKDFVALDKLKTAAGKAFPLTPGMEIEYWLEAVDNCDYPEAGGNVGKSKAYLVKIAPPDRNQKKQDEQRQQAQQEKEKHDKQQDKEQEKRDQQAAERKKGDDKDPGGKGQPEQKPDDFAKDAEKVKQALDDQKKKDESKGEAKGDPQTEPKGANKEKGPQDSKTDAGKQKDEQKQPGPGEAGEKKDEGKGGEQANKGQGKDGGQQGQQQAQQGPGDGKGKGQQDQQAGTEGQAKNKDGAARDKAPSQAKGQGQQQGQEQAGDGKGVGDKSEKQQAGTAKQGGKEDMAAGQKGSDKGAGNQGGQKTETAQAKGDGKDQQGAGQPKQGQGDAKAGPKEKEQVAQNHGAGNNGPQSGAGKEKGQGQEGAGQQAQGQGGAKGQEQQAAAGPKGQGKQGEKQQGAGHGTGQAKGAGPKSEQGGSAQAQSKQAQPDQAAKAGNGKGEPDMGVTRGNDTAKTEEATREDVARLEKELERQGQREEALDELSRVRKEARDPEVRKLAEEALKRAGATPQEEPGRAREPEKAGTQVAKAGPKGSGEREGSKNKSPEAGGAKGGGDQKQSEAGKGKDGGEPGKTETAKGDAKQGGRPQGGTAGQGTQGQQDDVRPNAIDTAAARRAGELQLENLKKKLDDPRIRSKLNWKDEDVTRFMERARAYQEWLRQQERASGEKPARGTGKSVLPSQGPYRVGQSANPTRDPLELGDAQAPPEFREAQRLFTSRPKQ